MIVIGTDTHKCTHTCAAAKSGTGELQGELTARAREPGFRELLDWGRELDSERIWALEDCRHVSGALERFLVGEGERVVRIPPKLMGESRKAERARGKSDPIDALAIARAALKEGPETLPVAQLDDEALELKLLLDHREDLVRARDPRRRPRPGALARSHRPPPRPRRADRPRSDRPRPGAGGSRAQPTGHGARAGDRCPGPRSGPAAHRASRLRPVDRGEAGGRDRGR